MRILRYNRCSTLEQNLDYQKKNENSINYSFVFDEKTSGMQPFFEREKGSIVKELILESKIDEISVYSVDRISRSIKDLCNIIEFLHENNVSLSIENLGVKSLVDGKETPAIMFLIHLQGAFAAMNYYDRREKQLAGIERAKLKGVYSNRTKQRGKETIDKWMRKPKIRKAIEIIKENPKMKNCDIAKISELHYNTIRKVRNLIQIPKAELV